MLNQLLTHRSLTDDGQIVGEQTGKYFFNYRLKFLFNPLIKSILNLLILCLTQILTKRACNFGFVKKVFFLLLIADLKCLVRFDGDIFELTVCLLFDVFISQGFLTRPFFHTIIEINSFLK